MEVKLMCACSKNVNIPTPPHPNPTCSVTSNMEVKLMCACSKNVNIPTPPHPNPTCSVTSNMALWHGRRNWHTRKASYRPWHLKHAYLVQMLFVIKRRRWNQANTLRVEGLVFWKVCMNISMLYAYAHIHTYSSLFVHVCHCCIHLSICLGLFCCIIFWFFEIRMRH